MVEIKVFNKINISTIYHSSETELVLDKDLHGFFYCMTNIVKDDLQSENLSIIPETVGK